MALTCTPGGPDDNSYVTLTQAKDYFANRLADRKLWERRDISDTDREAALIQATAEIEGIGGTKQPGCSQAPLFHGTPYYTDAAYQAGHFPRAEDYTVTATFDIPVKVREAVFQQAVHIIRQTYEPELVDRGKLRDEGVRQFAADGMSETLGSVGARPSHICPGAWRAIADYVVKALPVD